LRRPPVELIFSRQNLAFNPRTDAQIANIEKGGYVLKDWNDEIVARKIILIATGSEVELAMKAVERSRRRHRGARRVDAVDQRVRPPGRRVPRARAAARRAPRCDRSGRDRFWHKYVGLEGGVVGIDTFGESAPAGVLFKHFGFTVEHVSRRPRPRWPKSIRGARPAARRTVKLHETNFSAIRR
jgi:transketolase